MITAIVLAATLVAAQSSLTIEQITDSHELARFIHQEAQRVNGTKEFIVMLSDRGSLHLKDINPERDIRFAPLATTACVSPLPEGGGRAP